ncbi:MAG: hypothetical protein ACI9PY_001834 [Ascidiaceihabitans sp.]|jgi:hypothetical protein
MAVEKAFYIHAGGHRTGTSSVQMFLHDNLAEINSQGYDAVYPGRDGIPSGKLGLRLPSLRHGDTLQHRFVRKVRREIRANSPDRTRATILSEENIPGRMIHFFGSEFYPTAEARMKALRGGLGGPLKRVLFIVRPYDALYVSAFRKRAEDTAVEPFTKFRAALMKMNRGWPEFIASMRDTLQAEDTVVMTMSARGDNRNIIKYLVPELAQDNLIEPVKQLNVSATDTAMDVLQAHYKAGDTLTRTEWQQIITDNADTKVSTGFAEFEPDQKQHLRDLFDRDCDSLGALKGIRFIR